MLKQEAYGKIEYVVAADELQIIDVFIQPEKRRQGLAKSLIKKTINNHPECLQAFLEVRISNLPAINLYKKLGFKETGKRTKYYHNPTEDGLLMSLNLRQDSINI